MASFIIYLFSILLCVTLISCQAPCPFYKCREELVPYEPDVCMLRINQTLAYVSYSCRKRLICKENYSTAKNVLPS